MFSCSAEHEPAVRVSPGETLLVETKNAFGDQTFSPGETLEELSLEGADPLTGPIFVDGAEPDDTLAVEIDDIKTVGPGMQGVIPDFGILEWRSDVPLHFFEPRNGTIEWLRGIEIELRPNLGAIGARRRTARSRASGRATTAETWTRSTFARARPSTSPCSIRERSL